MLGTRPGFYEVLNDRTTAPPNEELQPNRLLGAAAHSVLPYDFFGRVPPSVALLSVCVIGYTGRLSQVWSVALDAQEGIQVTVTIMPGCIIRCWSYQMHVSLKHNPWLVLTVLIIDHSQACQKCQTAVLQLLLFCCSPSLRCFVQNLHWGKAKLFRPFQRE